jgi:hypothetical protein
MGRVVLRPIRSPIRIGAAKDDKNSPIRTAPPRSAMKPADPSNNTPWAATMAGKNKTGSAPAADSRLSPSRCAGMRTRDYSLRLRWRRTSAPY